MATQPESKVSAALRKGLEQAFPGSLWLKMHGSIYVRAGISDNLGCVDGRFFAVEVKIKGNKPTATQTKFLLDTVEAGGVGIVYTHTPDQPLALGLLKVMGIVQATLEGEYVPVIQQVTNSPF